MKIVSALLLIIIVFVGCKKSLPASIPSDTQDTIVISPANHPDTAKLALKDYYYTPGNLNAKGLDTFTLEFNRPIKVNYILFTENWCLPDLKYNVTGNGTTVKFYNFLCGGLGEQYTFEYSITDTLGNQLTDSITFDCYTRKITLQGNPINYFSTRDNQYCWVVTRSPNQMVCLGINDTTIKKSYDLNFIPWKAVYNYYNNKIYILSSAGDYTNRQNMYVMNPANGTIEKTILLPHDDLGKQLAAEDLAFGSNGFGLIMASNDNSNYSPLNIESQHNDSVYLDSSNYHSYGFDRVYTNFDGTKLIGHIPNGNCRFGIVDCFSHSATVLSTPVSPMCYNSYIVVNKKKDQIFVVNLQTTGYGQFIISDNTMAGASTDFDAYSGSEADFSYRSNENNYIYYFDNHVFGIVNYNTGDVLMNTDFAYNLKQIVATTDGKYILCTDRNSMVFFDTKIFYQNL